MMFNNAIKSHKGPEHLLLLYCRVAEYLMRVKYSIILVPALAKAQLALGCEIERRD